MSAGQMQAKDITDQAFLDAVRTATRLRGFVTRWDVGAILDGEVAHVRAMAAVDRASGPAPYPPRPRPQIPDKVVLAKAKALIRRGLLGGCTCECRGDFTIPGETL